MAAILESQSTYPINQVVTKYEQNERKDKTTCFQIQMTRRMLNKQNIQQQRYEIDGRVRTYWEITLHMPLDALLHCHSLPGIKRYYWITTTAHGKVPLDR